MKKNQWDDIVQRAKENETIEAKKQRSVRRIVKYVMLTVVVLVLMTGIGSYIYIQNQLKPVDKSNSTEQQITIPVGSSKYEISTILAEAGLVHHPQIFNYYMRLKNVDELQAGHYIFTPSMDADQIIQTLEEGGEPIFVDADTTITVIEGMQIDDIARLVDDKTSISAEEFIKTVNDADFVRRLTNLYPSLFESYDATADLKYLLEGYLYPATYDYFAGMTSEELVKEMIEAMNSVYYRLTEEMQETYLNFHQILTLASIIEREAVTTEDRGLVSGVFYNRMNIEMPLQSDITILYALGEHKEFVTYNDLEVDSPYNTYMYDGLPVGPINSPSLESIQAAILPTWNEYYYFVADLDTGDVYYSSTIEEHDELVEEYVNQRQESLEQESVESTESQTE